MAGSINKVMIIGHLGRDPEIRTFQNGGRVANLSVATSETWRDKTSGERRERTEWHRVTVFNDKLTEVIDKHLSKGSRVYIEGQLETRKWTDQAGAEKYVTEIVIRPFRGRMEFLDSPKGGARESRLEQQELPGTASPLSREGSPLDDDIPF